MKKAENTHQIPGSEDTNIREENPLPVESTENLNATQLSTDHDQVPEAESIKDLQPEIQEIESIKSEEDHTEETPVEVLYEPPVQAVSEVAVDPPEEVSEPVTEELPAELPEPQAPAELPKPQAPAELPEPPPVEALSETLAEQVETGLSEEIPEVVLSEPVEEKPEQAPDHIVDKVAEEPVTDLSEEGTEQPEEDLAEETDIDTYSREQLVGLLEAAVNEPEINSVKIRIALIKVAYLKKKKEENLEQYEKFIKDGGTKENFSSVEDPLEERFTEIFNIYKANKARFTEEQEKIKQDNLKKKQEILDELKHLVSSEETLKKTYDEFRTLQDRWKQIGMVPRTEINNLWQNYHFLVEKFFDKVKLNKELKDLDLKKNMEAKIALCEKTEELLLETSIMKSFKKLQKYHEDWKEIGPVPTDKKDEIWERFKITSDKINQRRREHYSRIEDEQQKNLETKTALCENAEEIINLKNETLKEWQDNTNKVNELLMVWKGVGAVPQKVNTDIWNRFKTSLDTFFSNKKEFFDKLKDQQIHNYNVKVDLCVQAEALKSSTDWRKTSNELIRLQSEWKNIGPVPKKHSEKIWKRFRAACDEFFNAKSNYFSNIQSHEEENLNKKVDLIKRLKEFQFTESKSQNLEHLKNFQREWTEIGHIPIKEKDKLQNEFRSIINEHLDRLKISEVEIIAVNFQTKLEALKNDPQSRRLISREKEILSGKISKLKEDINLWENNIGFLAESKNAAILKQEFEKKINKAKSELKVMEAKVKILKNQ